MGLFKKPEETKSGIKVLAYGATGSGKTLFALTFPKVVAIDSEAGMEFYKTNPNLKYLLNTTSFDEVEESLEEIEEELIDEISTFVLDSETKIYENIQFALQELVEKRARKKGQSIEDASLSQREWGKLKIINKRIQSTKIKLSSLGINIVSIAQEKDVKEKKGDDYVTVGYTSDTSKGFSYDYDVVLRFFTDGKGSDIKYLAEVLKDRTGAYQRGDIIQNPSYDNWKHIVDGLADKKVEVIDYKKDIDKDMMKEETESEKLDELSSRIKDFVTANKDDKDIIKPIMAKTKELELTSPFKPKTIEQAQEILDIIEAIQ